MDVRTFVMDGWRQNMLKHAVALKVALYRDWSMHQPEREGGCAENLERILRKGGGALRESERM